MLLYESLNLGALLYEWGLTADNTLQGPSSLGRSSPNHQDLPYHLVPSSPSRIINHLRILAIR